MLIGYVRDALQPQLAEDLVARMEEKVYVEDEHETRVRKPDVRIVEHPTPWEPNPGAAAAAVIDEPMLLEPAADPIRQRSVSIYDTAGRRIVTAIEILSPWNKFPGKAVNAYLRKREQYIDADINLVEIDLIRAGLDDDDRPLPRPREGPDDVPGDGHPTRTERPVPLPGLDPREAPGH